MRYILKLGGSGGMLHQENFEITTSETPCGATYTSKRIVSIIGNFQGGSQSGGNPLVLPHPPPINHCHVNKWMGYNKAIATYNKYNSINFVHSDF